VRSDPETLLLPVLQQLYQADKARANHLYMLQVCRADRLRVQPSCWVACNCTCS